MALLNEMWDDINVTSAVWVIEQALGHGNENDRLYAAWILERNANKLRVLSGELIWPILGDSLWPSTLGFSTKGFIITALCRAMLANNYDSYSEYQLHFPVMFLHSVLSNDSDHTILSNVALFISVLTSVTLDDEETIIFTIDGWKLPILQIITDANQILEDDPEPTGLAIELADQLKAWTTTENSSGIIP